MSARSGVPMSSPQTQPPSFEAVQGPRGRAANAWVRRSVWVACCLMALVPHAQVSGQGVRPDVSRAVEVAPPADWKPGDPLLTSDDAPPVTRVPSERSTQAGEGRGVRQRQAAPAREAPAIQRLASKPKVGERARGSRLRQAPQKAQVASRPARSTPSRDRRSVAAAAELARKSVGKPAAVAGQKKTARDMSRTVRTAAASAKAPSVASASAKTAKLRAAPAAQAKQGRARAKRAAPQSPRSAKPDRSPSPRASRKGAPGDAKQTVRRAR